MNVTVSAIAYSYWRRVKSGARDFSAVPASVAAEVKALAGADVAAGVITAERYAELIGEGYSDKN